MNKNFAIVHEEEEQAQIERLQKTAELLQDRITLLERENGELVNMLKERGVAVNSSSALSLELPPPVSAPVQRIAEIRALMTPASVKLLDEICGAGQVLLLLATETAVDTGRWLFKGRVWAAVTAGELVLLASGRKPFFQKTPLASLRKSLYNHVTGELVLAPNRGWKLDHIAVPPLDGYQLLAQIYGSPTQGEKK